MKMKMRTNQGLHAHLQLYKLEANRVWTAWGPSNKNINTVHRFLKNTKGRDKLLLLCVLLWSKAQISCMLLRAQASANKHKHKHKHKQT